MPTGVYPRTAEHRDRIRRGLLANPEIGLWMIGRKDSPETKEKKRQACLNRKNKFGRYHTEDGLIRMRVLRKPRIDRLCLFCGTSLSIKPCQIKRKKYCSHSCASRARKGEKAAHWKGGTGSERHTAMSRFEYKEWRTAVFLRDDYTCQKCYSRGIRINAHHIKPWKNHIELRYDVDNGKTLCVPCHRSEHASAKGNEISL